MFIYISYLLTLNIIYAEHLLPPEYLITLHSIVIQPFKHTFPDQHSTGSIQQLKKIPQKIRSKKDTL